MKKLSAILIGAGNRGECYSSIMAKRPEKFGLVAVAEPIVSRRNFIKELYDIPDELCFDDYNPLFEKGKIADFAIIATMDRQHFAPAMKAIKLGYDILLEKPIAPTKEECVELTKAANKRGVKVIVCTVLRYTDVFCGLKQIIDSGRIGKVVSINHEERVGYVHQSHSFVRGNWGNSERSSTMLLQKSCHDLDILQWLLGKKCKSIQSFGNLTYFTQQNAPDGSPEYCVEGCPVGDTCPYNAVKLYYDDKNNSWFRTTCTRKHAPTDQDVMEAITKTQYGKCVYKCDNDVVDNQIVNMLFEDDITVSFSMSAFNAGGRFIHIMGTKGEISASLGSAPAIIYDFETKKSEHLPLVGVDGIAAGHGGGDDGIINALYGYLCGDYEGNSVPTINETLYSHMLVFAAEQSRLSGKVVDIEDFIKE